MILFYHRRPLESLFTEKLSQTRGVSNPDLPVFLFRSGRESLQKSLKKWICQQVHFETVSYHYKSLRIRINLVFFIRNIINNISNPLIVYAVNNSGVQ